MDKRTVRNTHPGRSEIVITIHPGEWGTRFKLLNGYGSAHNRDIQRAHARKMKESWAAIQIVTEVHLIKAGDDVYYILDGQHRVYFACEVLGHETELRAIVYDDIASLPGEGDEKFKVANYIRILNGTAKNFTIADHLNNYKGLSPWVKVFEDMGIPVPSYRSGKSYCWVNIIRAHLLAEESNRIGKVSTNSSNLKTMLVTWLHADEKTIKSRIPAILWWLSMGSYGQEVHSRGKRKFTALWAYSMWLIAFLVWEQNDKKHLSSAQVRQRIEHSAIRGLEGLSHSKLLELQDIFLSSLNRKSVRNIITLFGYPGPSQAHQITAGWCKIA